MCWMAFGLSSARGVFVLIPCTVAGGGGGLWNHFIDSEGGNYFSEFVKWGIEKEKHDNVEGGIFKGLKHNMEY